MLVQQLLLIGTHLYWLWDCSPRWRIRRDSREWTVRFLTLATQAVCVAIVMMTGLFAEANIFSEDRRQDLWPVPAELQPIGVLRSLPDDGGWGTAFLVDECHIMTAYHVAFPAAVRKGAPATKEMKSTFHVGRTAGTGRGSVDGFSAMATATPVKWGLYTTKNYLGLTQDWAVLKLDSCLGRHFGSLKMYFPEAVYQQRSGLVHLAGYPHDRAQAAGISLESNCRLRAEGPETLFGVDCAFAEGTSGGPLMEKIDGVYYVAGIAIRRMRAVNGILKQYDETHRNIVVDTVPLLPQLSTL